MSLSGPSRLGVLGAVLLLLIVVMLGGILWSFDRFHREVRNNTDAIDRVGGTVKELTNAVANMQVVVGGAGTNGATGSGTKRAVRYPIGGMSVSYRAEPSTFNRWVSNEGAITTILNNHVQDGLFNVDPKIQVRPALATSWEVSDDKLKYTFHLRRGVKFSDGSDFSAKDVLFTYRLIKDPGVNSDMYKEEFAEVLDAEAVDDHTVVFHYKTPYWRGIYALGFTLKIGSSTWIRKRMQKIANDYPNEFPEGSYSLNPGEKGFGKLYNKIRMPAAGTGPYIFDEKRSWVQGQQVSLYRWSGSWWFREFPGKWNLACLRWRFIRDEVALWEEVKKQAIDAKVVDHEQWADSFSKDKAITEHFNHYVYDHMGIGNSVVYWNCRREVFKDKRTRQAMAHLIDRKTMREVFNKGVGKFATCYFKPTNPEYSHDIEPRLLDIDKARTLLAEAGWKDTDKNGTIDKDGKEFRFAMLVPASRKLFMRWAQLWQKDMAKAGVKMEILPREWATFISQYYDHEFDACLLVNSHPDPWIEPYEEFMPELIGNGQPNHSGWVNHEAAKILKAARPEFDVQKRIALYKQFNRIRDDGQPALLLLHDNVSVVAHKRFGNVKVWPRGLVQEDWYVPLEKRLYDDNGNPK